MCPLQVQALERRLSAAEGREAQLISELRSAEAAAAERDAAVAAAATLQERLGELGRDRSQLEHHKQVKRDAGWLMLNAG